jgi:5'-nucleotidase
VTEIAPRRLTVDGTPADCGLLAFRKLLEEPPAVGMSGINRGLNVGEDVDYSGTVGAATEAALQGCRGSLAVSLKKEGYPRLLPQAARFAKVIVGALLANPLPAGCFMNTNLPAKETDRIRWTRQGNPLPAGFVEVGDDPRGKRFYWIAERPGEQQPPSDTDRGALAAGLISLSLLTLDRNWVGEVVRPPLDGYREDPA